MTSERIEMAYQFSKESHKEQKRKFSGRDYFTHPIEVSRIIKRLIKDEDLIIAGLLHDTIEDTPATYEEIEEEFGKKVADLVLEVTSDDNEAIKKYGKANYLGYKMSRMSPEALVVKLADRLHNVGCLRNRNIPIKFVEKYFHETLIILSILKISDHMNRIHSLDSVRDTLIEKIEVILKFLEIRYKFKVGVYVFK